MKKFITVLSILGLSACTTDNSVLTEQTFFLVMTNIQTYPEEYIDKDLTFDCFTYELKATDGTSYMCGVRQCSSGFGCKCGKDTIIGFILNSEKQLPEPKNQYDNTNDKLLCGTGCNTEDNGKIKIVCTLYPEYEWINAVIDGVDGIDKPKLLINSSIDFHSYQASVDDIVNVKNADLFVYVGGESDEWIEKVDITNKDQKQICLLDVLGDAAKLEEEKEGMQEDEHHHHHDDEDEDHEHEEGEDHDHGFIL